MEKVINIEKINCAVMTGTPEEVIELCKFIHIESCFDYACEPPADFLEQCEKYWSGHHSFCGTVERKNGSTWYTVETVCDGNEPLTQKVKRLIFLTGRWLVHDSDTKLWYYKYKHTDSVG